MFDHEYYLGEPDQRKLSLYFSQYQILSHPQVLLLRVLFGSWRCQLMENVDEQF